MNFVFAWVCVCVFELYFKSKEKSDRNLKMNEFQNLNFQRKIFLIWFSCLCVCVRVCWKARILSIKFLPPRTFFRFHFFLSHVILVAFNQKEKFHFCGFKIHHWIEFYHYSISWKKINRKNSMKKFEKFQKLETLNCLVFFSPHTHTHTHITSNQMINNKDHHQ